LDNWLDGSRQRYPEYSMSLENGMGQDDAGMRERAAAVSERQLQVNMLQHIRVAAWSVMPDGTSDIVNRLWVEYTGQTSEYMHSHPEAWMTTIQPEDWENATEIYWEGIRSGNGFMMEASFFVPLIEPTNGI
jgi:hypothetical protein